PAREHVDDALAAADGTQPLRRLDRSVDLLEQLLGRARLRNAFAADLDGYWRAESVSARIASINPLLETLARVVGSGVHALPPYVVG
ncbi:MAG TPA: hypothetical protein VM759_00345, partial [Longimicrobium sp.]|nr:hypothetical protein [Longimicrobium sp.]